MLNNLYIKNYAIIKEIDIPFGHGLNVITGETGAGKSIIMGALQLILGQRADTKVLYDPDHKCIVEASINIADYKLKKFFTDEDLEYDDELIIRREISSSGRSRAFINDSPVNLDVLKELAAGLIDLNKQFDNLDTGKQEFQIKVLNAVSSISKELDKYQNTFNTYKSLQKEFNSLKSYSEKQGIERDYIKHQVDELDLAAFQEGEEESLSQQMGLLSNAENIKSALSKASFMLLDQEPSLLDQLREIRNEILSLEKYHNDFLGYSEKLESSLIDLEELAAELNNKNSGIELNESQLAEVTERHDNLHRLLRKHQVNDLPALLSLHEKLSTELSKVENIGENLEKLQSQIAASKNTLIEIGKKISAKRKKNATPFKKEIVKMLQLLGMEHANFEVDLKHGVEPNVNGTDEIAFLFSPNKGSAPKPIKNIASGGEMARLSLCIKSLVAENLKLPILIFDEIDTGISGDVAMKMGKIIKKLSAKHQVLIITHSPQIAINASQHFFVYKTLEAERTLTRIKELDRDEKIREIATMLGGSPPSDAAIANAEALLQTNEN